MILGDGGVSLIQRQVHLAHFEMRLGGEIRFRISHCIFDSPFEHAVSLRVWHTRSVAGCKRAAGGPRFYS